jgi:hypothetical protein
VRLKGAHVARPNFESDAVRVNDVGVQVHGVVATKAVGRSGTLAGCTDDERLTFASEMAIEALKDRALAHRDLYRRLDLRHGDVQNKLRV